MQKTVITIMIFMILFSLVGCSKTDANQNAESKTEVIINVPEDDTVNGYRNKVQEIAENEALYCANKNSKVFHKQSCSSVNKMKDENKYFAKDKNELLEDGYQPCKSCNP